ncbi:hypothetical protein [Chondrinema litorale]|uniref:hypothetical protein n=1 Tax=Chondrinema litorale TaxID=2994555 RepID=UPI0025436BDA|nr:hypothetical protein [Chondrinema litorale]UZR97585.1 hypothetical protein OQ292_26540 [Chondrinema litorale]
MKLLLPSKICLGLLFLNFALFAQESIVPSEASPFTAVEWEADKPMVQVEGEWYYFEKLDDISKDEILAYCKEKYPDKWQKRFSEDLIEVLEGMNYQPEVKVTLALNKDGKTAEYQGVLTSENRKKVRTYNYGGVYKEKPKMITGVLSKDKIVEDLAYLEFNFTRNIFL